MNAELKFDDLHRGLVKALDKLGFEEPTPVQAQAYPLLMARHDLLASAETGSGKTAAFVLPILQRLLTTDFPHDAGTLALILAPTRELAQQIQKHIEKLAAHTPIKAGLITGGESFKSQAAMLRKNPEFVVATPGRLLEHMERNTTDFDSLAFLVLDEGDRMLDLGFGDDVLTIAAQCNQQRQTLLFSATLHHRGIAKMADQVLQEFETLAVNPPRQQHKDIQHQVILADHQTHKKELLNWLLKNETYQRALVFCNTRDAANKLGGLMRYHKIRAGTLHGEMSQDERKEVMNAFIQGKFTALITTDVAARGLDIKGVELVINFDMARNGDDYTHRVGRTGRAGKQGTAISLIQASEWNLMISVENYLKGKFERRIIEEHKGKYRGPKKVKSSGKAAGTKKKKNKTDTGKKSSKKTSSSSNNKKPKTQNKKRTASPKVINDGFAPLKKKTK